MASSVAALHSKIKRDQINNIWMENCIYSQITLELKRVTRLQTNFAYVDIHSVKMKWVWRKRLIEKSNIAAEINFVILHFVSIFLLLLWLYTEIYYIMFTGGVVYSDSYSQWHGILKLKRLSVADDRLHLWENKPYYNELSCTFCLFYWKACDVMSWGVSQWSLHHCIEVSPHLFSFFTVYITFTFTTTSLRSQTFFAFLAST